MTEVPIEAAPLLVARVLRKRGVTVDKPRMSCFDGTGREWLARDNDDGTVTLTKAAQDANTSSKATAFQRLVDDLARAKSAYDAAEAHYQETKAKSTAELASARAQEAQTRKVAYESALKAKIDFEAANPIVADASLRQMLAYWEAQTAKRQEAVKKLVKALADWDATVEQQKAKFKPTKDQKEFAPDDPTKDAIESLNARLEAAKANVHAAKDEQDSIKRAIKKVGYEPEQNIVITVDLDGPWLFV